MHRISLIVATAAAIVVAVVGLHWGTYAAGGSDSSCYALMADAFAAGKLQPTSALVAQVPWSEAGRTFSPGGFVTSETNPSASAPVCAPGFSVLLALLMAVGGRDAIFMLTPIAGALLVWFTFVTGRAIANPVAGAMAAVLIASSPATLYQVVQPMNDVTTAALWMAAFVALLSRRWALAGACCGLALLVRPNLLPLALVAALAIGIRDLGLGIRDWGLGIRTATRATVVSGFSRTVIFAAAALPFALTVLWLNNALYGSPFRTGYGQLGQLFGLSVVPINASRYSAWLIETQTPFPLLAFAAPFVVAREKRADAVLAIGLILATCLTYFLYTPFDEWSYLRFLLPAIALMVVLASAVTVHVVTNVLRRLARLKADTTGSASASIVALITAALALFCVRTADDRLAFNLKFLEQRYRSAGLVVRDRLPANAVVLSVWDSGAVRFHGRKEALIWAALDPAWFDRAVSWLDGHGHTPYILVESWEEAAFRNRFESHSDIGKLDWPPKYEIDRVVRIFDPNDRARYHGGENVITEYLWPMRD
jgi:hypothetical protein